MRICFLFEFKDKVGGVTSLLITLISELRKRNVEVLLINFKDGIVARELEKEGITLSIIDLGENRASKIGRQILPTDFFVVFSFKEVFRHFFDANPRLIYYNVNAFLAEVGLYKFGINPKKSSRKLIQELIEKESLVLMDDTGIRNVSDKLNMKIENPKFLPIPVTVPPINEYLGRNNAIDVLRLTYIGRAVDWKIYPLKKILDDIAKSSFQNKIQFTIVVDSIANLKKIVDPKEYESHYLKVILKESIPPSEVNELLSTQSDINFGMGTAALDSAKLGVPTVLMDFSSVPFPMAYRYDWLYNTTYFCLGKDIASKYEVPATSMTMAELVQKSFDRKYLNEQSALNYDYVTRNHSVANVVDLLLKFEKGAEFRFRDARPYVLYYSRLHGLLRTLSKFGKQSN